MLIKKIVSLSYNENSLFCHPKTMDEFTNIQEKLMKSFKDGDKQGMLIAACQLMPDRFEIFEEEV